MTPAELQTLCADRPLVTPELHAANDFYGHAALLKRYTGRPAWSCLKVAIEHGVMLNEAIWEVDLRTEMPVVLCASPVRAAEFERRSGRRAVAIGPLVHYAAPFASAAARRSRRLVVFPPHSSHRVQVRYDQGGFLRRLDALARDFQEVSMCLYWKDVLAGAAAPYLERGYECVTAGHMFDPAFLPRLVAILDSAALVYTNEIGSQVLYATLRDRPVWVERDEVAYLAPREVLATDASEFVEHPNVRRLLALFSQRRDDVAAEQRRFVEELAGAGAVRSAAELGALLDDAETRYRNVTSRTKRLVHLVRRGDWVRRRAIAWLRAALPR